MSLTLTLKGKTPNQTQFALDTFTESYKCDATADVVLTDPSVPQLGDAHPDYAFMFVTQRPCQETGESASALDLIYTGCLTDDGDGNPVLPSHQHQDGNDISSSSSSRAVSGLVAGSPLTAQYYSPTNTRAYFSFGGAGTTEADDPTIDVTIISLTIGDTTLSFGGTVQAIVDDFFSPLIVSTIQSQEVVAGQYWQNTATKKTTLSPFIFTLPSGPFVSLAAPGTGYTVGDTLTISGGGGVAVIVLTQVGIADSVTGWTESSNSCTTAENNIAATGGTGSGARFNIIIAP